MTTEINTPGGNEMTADRYLELVSRMRKRNSWRRRAARCILSHEGCAAWTGGPCSAEVEDSLEDARRATKEGSEG